MAEYIEREKLIKFCEKIIRDRWNEKVAPVSWSAAYADFIDDINDQPIADVVPVIHSKWVYGEFDIPHCSECGHEVMPNVISPFCPNCGAKMDV